MAESDNLPGEKLYDSFPIDLLKEVPIPKHKSGTPYTKEEDRIRLLSHCRREGRDYADQVIDGKKEQSEVFDTLMGILSGRQDRLAVDIWIANYSDRTARNIVKMQKGLLRVQNLEKRDIPEVERRRSETYSFLWRGLAKRG